MKMKMLLSTLAAVILTGCATTPNATQANLAVGEVLITSAVSTATVGALIYKPQSRPIIEGIGTGFTLLSQTNQLSITDIETQFGQFKLIGGTNNPIVALEVQNISDLITAFGAQLKNVPTNQTLAILQGLAGANATGIQRGLAAISP